jgi:hypothetical protein
MKMKIMINRKGKKQRCKKEERARKEGGNLTLSLRRKEFLSDFIITHQST